MSIYSSLCIQKEWETELGHFDIATAIFKTEDFLRISYNDDEVMVTPTDARMLANKILHILDREE